MQETDARDKVAERAQDSRDLKQQIDELANDPDEQEIIFRDTSPRIRLVTIYSMVTGEKIQIPRSLLDRTLLKRLPMVDGGGFMFTGRKNEAPKFRYGTVKCFLHRDAPERTILNDIGLNTTFCPAGKLASAHSKRVHAIHRHKNEWAAYQEYVEDAKEARAEKRHDEQLAATLKLAEAAAGRGADKPKATARKEG